MLTLLSAMVLATPSVYQEGGRPPPPPPAGRPWSGRQLPDLGKPSDWPDFTTVFQNGECDAGDSYGAVPGIALQKKCYGCFRIPALARNPVTGVLHAFVEARRSINAQQLGVGCEDLPDTHLAWKKSLDNGTTWSKIQILARQDNLTRAQPTPVIDCKTGMIHLTFAQWKPKNWRGATPMSKSQYPMIMNSSDDGEHWTTPIDVNCPTCKGGTFRTAYPQRGGGFLDIVPGDSRGLCVLNRSLPLGYRLISPTWSGSQYSDDGGHSWQLHLQSTGENSITTWSVNKSQGAFVQTKRAGKGTCPGATGRGADVCYRFSADGIVWGAFHSPASLWPMLTNSADCAAAVGVPGGMIFIHGGGVALPPPVGHERLRSDSGSGGSGISTFFSPDGQRWKLIRHVWPLYGGYSTVEAVGRNALGEATQYGTLFEAGGLFGKRQAILFQAFNVSDLPTTA
jgi:hypothetical protein